MCIRDSKIKEPNLINFLDLVSLGTVCDVVPLIGLNRAFVFQGLRILSRRQNIGLKMLSDISLLSKKPDEEDLGFFFGPRINAGGRVGKSDIGEKLLITKIAWETDGVRSVRNDIKIKEEFNFKRSAEDILITSQLRSALIFNKEIKAVNYNLDTYKKKIYIYGIAHSKEERQNVVEEAKNITDVEDVIASILLVEDLRVQKD